MVCKWLGMPYAQSLFLIKKVAKLYFQKKGLISFFLPTTSTTFFPKRLGTFIEVIGSFEEEQGNTEHQFRDFMRTNDFLKNFRAFIIPEYYKHRWDIFKKWQESFLANGHNKINAFLAPEKMIVENALDYIFVKMNIDCSPIFHWPYGLPTYETAMRTLSKQVPKSFTISVLIGMRIISSPEPPQVVCCFWIVETFAEFMLNGVNIFWIIH